MFERARLRLALFFATAFSLILLAVGISAYAVMAGQLDKEIDNSIASATEDIGRIPNRDILRQYEPRGRTEFPMQPGRGGGTIITGIDGGGPRIAEEQRSTISSDVFFLVITDDGRVVNNARNLDIDEFPFDELLNPETSATQEFTTSGENYRVVRSIFTADDGTTATIVVGRSLEARNYQLRLLAIVLGIGGIAGAVLTLGGGWWLAGLALVPIRRSLDTQRRFVSDASHELRTPIAVMKANAELLLRHPDQTVEANIDQVAAINEEADHLTKLVGDLLTLARADEHQLEVVRQRVSLAETLEGLVRDMTPLAEAKGVKLSSNLAQGEIDGDPQRIRQLLAILLDNALKFTPEGGTIRVQARKAGSRWLLSVADSGPGIPFEAQHRIFDRFFRVEESRTQAGTGLGLSIARWVAEAHQGRITVASSPGHGATFTVNLPAS